MVLLPLLLGLVGCGPSASPGGSGAAQPEKPKTTKRVTAAMMGNPASPIDRFIGGRSGGGVPGSPEFAKMVGSGLSVGKDNDSVFVPQLATALPSVENGQWTISPDGTMETTWTIRPGAKWHDGAPLTSADIVFTAMVEQDKELPVVIDPAYAFIMSITAPDPQTVTVAWKNPYITADQFFSLAPIPEHILGQPYANAKESFVGLPYWNTEMVAAGPYRVAQWVQDQYAVLDAFDGFVLGRPKIDQIVVKFLADENAFMGSILAGDVDVTIGKSIIYEQAVEIRGQWSSGHIETRAETVIKMWPQFVDPKPAIMANVQYRKALFYALNRQELVESLVPGGASSVAHSILLPEEPLYNAGESAAVKYEFDPRKASTMIEELGYAKGTDGLYHDPSGELLTVQIQATGEAQNTKPSFAIVDYWKRIGLAADVDVVAIQLQNDRKYRAEFPGLNLQGSTSGIQRISELTSAQARLPQNNYTGRNFPRYVNPEWDDLVKGLFSAVPIPERTQALQKVIHHMTDQVVMYSLYYSIAPTMVANRMVNVGFYPSWNSYEWDVK